MSSYAAFLGHQPHISLAELSAALPGMTPERKAGAALVFSSHDELDQDMLHQWGGTWLLAKQLHRAKEMNADDVLKILAKELQGVRGKVTFGLRAEGVSPNVLRDLYRRGKDTVKKAGKSVRYVGTERKAAATALLRDEGLLTGKGGAELVLLQDKDFFWLGKTIAAQDPDAYTERDMEKPVRDTRVGLLPPKLAQVMLNLGQWLARSSLKTHDSRLKTLHVFDPFCGTGVIPLEALLRGWPVLASDASLKAVNGCQKNIEWLRKTKDILKSKIPSTVWKQDATAPFALKETPDVVVTETTLGPGLTDRPTTRDAQSLCSEAEKLEAAFLQNLAQTLPGVPAAVMFPAWYLRTGPIFLQRIWGVVEKLGFTPVLPPHVQPSVPGRTSLLYRRPDQVVGREIVLLRPKGA